MNQPITDAEIRLAMTARGGWTRQQLAAWGVGWPPPKGWRKALVESGVPESAEPGGEAPPFAFDTAGRLVDAAGHPVDFDG